MTRAAHDIDVIPSGVISLDVALGIGGYHYNWDLWTWVINLNSTSYYEGGKDSAFVDAEHALDPKYAKL